MAEVQDWPNPQLLHSCRVGQNKATCTAMVEGLPRGKEEQVLASSCLPLSAKEPTLDMDPGLDYKP